MAPEGPFLMNEDADVTTMPFTCAIRPARPRDCDAIAALAAQLGYECTGEEVQERLGHMQDPSEYAVFVSEVGGDRIAGWIGVYIFRSVETRSCAEISGLVVDHSIRSRGIGKMLLDAAEEWARSKGRDAVSVRSNVQRDRAHQFYANNGYDHVKTQKEFRKSL